MHTKYGRIALVLFGLVFTFWLSRQCPAEVSVEAVEPTPETTAIEPNPSEEPLKRVAWEYTFVHPETDETATAYALCLGDTFCNNDDLRYLEDLGYKMRGEPTAHEVESFMELVR